MLRKLSLALAVSAALSTAGVYALGLGEIVTKSALNEDFSADIALLDVNPEDVDGVKVSLASTAAFARAGLERPFFLSRLRFKPMLLDDGSAVVRISTRDPVREPFLNFLLEINWPKGRLIREYTVLLDPPVTTDRRPPPIAAPVVAPAPKIARAPEASTAVAAAQPRPAATAGETLTVRRGDTLWGIAKSLDFPGATTNQVMMSLYQDNPQAFAGGDINRLLAGAELLVPGREGVLRSGADQADRDFRAATGVGQPAETRPSRLRIATPPSDDQPPGATGGDIERVKTDLMMVRETSETTRQETDELRGRIRELEAQLTDIRRLLKLKSDELALLQSDRADGRGTAAEVEEPVAAVAETAMAEPAGRGGAPELHLAPREPETEPPELTDQPSMVEPDTASASTPSPGTESRQSPEPAVQPAAPAPAAPPPAPKPVSSPAAKPAPVAEPGMLDRILGDTTLLGIGGAVVVVLLSLGWLLVRRRRSAEDEFQDSVLLAPGESSSTVDLEQEPDVGGVKGDQSEETSFISDFSPSDIDALQEETGEVDPAAEADVYIAYGRYQQAESLIQQAIDKSPDRLDLKLKLLEIYFTTRSVSSFVGLAEELEAAGAARQDPALWERVLSMGQELVPSHALFGRSAGAGEPAASPQADDDGQSLLADSDSLANLDLDLDTELSELPDKPLGGASEFVDLGTGSVLEPPAGGGAPAAPPAGGGELDAESEFSLDLGDLGSLEDIDLGDLQGESDAQSDVGFGVEVEPEQEIAPLELDHASSPAATEEAGAAGGFEEEEIPAISLDELDLGGDSGPATVDEDSQPLSDLLKPSDWSEEIETKLDLARAYQEMGDSDGAREILDEVMKEGDEVQQKTAKALLDQLG